MTKENDKNKCQKNNFKNKMTKHDKNIFLKSQTMTTNTQMTKQTAANDKQMTKQSKTVTKQMTKKMTNK